MVINAGTPQQSGSLVGASYRRPLGGVAAAGSKRGASAGGRCLTARGAGPLAALPAGVRTRAPAPHARHARQAAWRRQPHAAPGLYANTNQHFLIRNNHRWYISHIAILIIIR